MEDNQREPSDKETNMKRSVDGKARRGVKPDVTMGTMPEEGIVPHAGRRILPIAVPFGMGAGLGGTELGPEALLAAGLIERLTRLGHKLEPCEWLDVSTATLGIAEGNRLQSDQQQPNAVQQHQVESEHHSSVEDSDFSSSLKHKHEVERMSRLTADSVEQAVRRSTFPILLGGDHSTAIGSLAGLSRCHERLGVIWLDAHGDLNTEETTTTGNIHGMVLAIAMGLGAFKLTDIGDGSRLLARERIVLVGARDLDDGEKEWIKASGIHCFTMRDIDRLGMEEVAARALAIAGRDTDAIHLSLDLDSLDPLEAAGVGTPVPGGITFREARLAMEKLGASGKIGSLDIVELNPSFDHDNRTAALAVELASTLLGGRLL